MITLAYLAMLVALLVIVALAYLLGRIDQREKDENQLRRMLAEIKAEYNHKWQQLRKTKEGR